MEKVNHNEAVHQQYDDYILKNLLMFLDRLSCIKPYNLMENKDDLEELSKNFKLIYQKNSWHYYSDISQYCYKSNDENLENVLENLSLIESYLEENRIEQFNDCDENDYLKIIKKLIDHIRLEVFRNANLETRIKKDTVKFLNDKASPIDDRLKKTVESGLKELNFEVITIISIFSAIIMTFFGGLSFFGEALRNMNEVSVKLTLTVICFVGLVMINVFYFLFHFISKLLDKSFLNEKYLIFINIFFIFLIFIINFLLKGNSYIY